MIGKLDKKSREILAHMKYPTMFESRAEQFIFNFFEDECLLPIVQYKIGKYFVDFAWPDLNLVLEYDGIVHLGKEEKDWNRVAEIRKQGYQVLVIKKTTNGFEYFPGDRCISDGKLTPILQKISILIRKQKVDHKEKKYWEKMYKRSDELNNQINLLK